MKQFKDLNACIAKLQALLAAGDLRPEQMKDVEVAIEELRRLRRNPHVNSVAVYRCVRIVAERLLNALLK